MTTFEIDWKAVNGFEVNISTAKCFGSEIAEVLYECCHKCLALHTFNTGVKMKLGT